MKNNKEKKRKPKYGLLSCVAYSLKLTWKSDRATTLSSILIIPVALILSAIGLYMPTIILRELETSDSFWRIVSVILALVGAQMIFTLIRQYIDIKNHDAEHILLQRMIYDIKARDYDMDYFLSLDKEIKPITERAYSACQNNHTAGIHFVHYFVDIIINILSFILFGSIVAIIHPALLCLLVVGCIINYLMAGWQQKRSYQNKDARNLTEKKMSYVAYKVSLDLKYGKDIRLFGLADFFDTLIKKLSGERLNHQEKLERDAFISALVSFIIILIRDGVAYAFLITSAIEGTIDAADFVLYFSAITQLSGFISGILNTWSMVHNGALEISDYREFFDIKNKLNHDKGIPLSTHKQLSIEFKNVSYTYPDGEHKILDNVSFKISAGEKIALVGINGAGKTTLTMLMCGLLVPDEGKVLIDGHSVYEYNHDELYSLFALVPQKYSLLPISIAENIALADTEAGETIDMPRLERCIELSGLKEKIESLPLGANTPLNRQVNPNATDLSGGETQKLLLARAMYREASILILDEPTAALDPIAEDRMYQRYNEITDTTSVFISHRLASTRFCDRIFLLDKSVIAETGTHDELMAKGGKYRELFDIQAKYYKEGNTDEQ